MAGGGRAALALAIAVALAGGANCKKPVPAEPTPGAVPLPPVEILKDGRWLFTYVEPSGQFATTDKPASVPEASRRLVRVLDPEKSISETQDRTSIYVLDLNELLNKGKASARAMLRGAFETGALAQLPPGESSMLAGGHAGGPGAPAPAEPSPKSTGGAPVVTLYGTSWCGACRAARTYMTSRKIPFADKDIERDPTAARELAEKATKLGIPTDRVPILDVRGRLMVGFDERRLESLLGEAT